MTLPQNPKIGDIITELQDLTLINQKAELAGVVGEPTTSTSNNQDFISTIQDAKDIIATKTGQSNTLPLLDMVNGITSGKKWASGTSQLANNNLTITGLDFSPSFLIVNLNSASISSTARYFVTTGIKQGIPTNSETYFLISAYNINGNNYHYVSNNQSQFTADGFNGAVISQTTFSNVTVDWILFE